MSRPPKDQPKRKPGRPRKTEPTATPEPAAEPVTYRTRYEEGERPQQCKCGSRESLVLMTIPRKGVPYIWRRRRCKACGKVWMSRTPTET